MSLSISVQKFGSSVLRGEADLATAVHAIYADLRRGRRVVAVVSALGDTTDQLLAQARSATEAPDARVIARLLSTGEARAAALLALALERAGIPVGLLGSENAGIVTEGDLLDARPIGLDEELLLGELAERPVVVLPGFVGRRLDGELTLLGRGGSDLTAVFVAGRLRAERCVLFKDVDGLYEWDPSDAERTAPRRFERCSYADAVRLSGRIVQHKAVSAAAELGLEFEVGTLNGLHSSLVGERDSILLETGLKVSDGEGATPEAPRALRVGLLGLGTVGGGVLEHLRQLGSTFEVAGVLVRDVAKHTGPEGARGLEGVVVTSDPDEFFNADLDVVVEALGGQQPARDLIERALVAGAHVVSANKAALAGDGLGLRECAADAQRLLLGSAAVGGAVPMLEAAARLRDSLPSKLEGVLNGTSSFVLDRIAGGDCLTDAVQAAQDRGLAEADPTLDLDGTDVAHKLELLALEAFGPKTQLVWRERLGVEQAGSELFESARLGGGSVKLVGRAERIGHGAEQRVELMVAPQVLCESHPLAQLRGAGSGLIVELPGQGQVVLRGEGAGRWPTAESVMGDLLQVGRQFAAEQSVARQTGSTRAGR